MKPWILSLIFIWYEITSVIIITATITTATAETSTILTTLSSEISSSTHTQQPATSPDVSTSTTTGQEGTTVKPVTSTSNLNTTTEGLKQTTASWWSYRGSTLDSRWLCIYNNGSDDQTTNSTSVMPWWWCRLLADTTTSNLMQTTTPQSLPATTTLESVALSTVASVVTTARPLTIGSVNITAHQVTACWLPSWCLILTTIHPDTFVTTANSSNVTVGWFGKKPVLRFMSCGVK